MKFFLSSLFLVACQAATLTDMNPDILYKKTLRFEVDGYLGIGMAVIPIRDRYSIKLQTPQQPDYLLLETCHREWMLKSPGKTPTIDYKPVPHLEDHPSCDVSLGVFDIEGKNQWGLIVRRGSENLYASMSCDGEFRLNEGISICQARRGLTQKIAFSEPVTGYWVERCGPLSDKSGKEFTFAITRGACLYLFSDGKEEHRLVTFGYDEIAHD